MQKIPPAEGRVIPQQAPDIKVQCRPDKIGREAEMKVNDADQLHRPGVKYRLKDDSIEADQEKEQAEIKRRSVCPCIEIQKNGGKNQSGKRDVENHQDFSEDAKVT